MANKKNGGGMLFAQDRTKREDANIAAAIIGQS